MLQIKVLPPFLTDVGRIKGSQNMFWISRIMIWKHKYNQNKKESNYQSFTWIWLFLPSGCSWCPPLCGCQVWSPCTPATAAPLPCPLRRHPAALGAWPLLPGDRQWSPVLPVGERYYSVAQAPRWGSVIKEVQRDVNNWIPIKLGSYPILRSVFYTFLNI